MDPCGKDMFILLKKVLDNACAADSKGKVRPWADSLNPKP